jgi:hypothetical protein
MRHLVPLLAASVFVLSACDTQDLQDDFARRATLPPSNFTRTDADGRVISEDEDDWQTAPVYRGVITVEPAFPNPVGDAFVTIPVYVRFSNSIRGGLNLRAYGGSGFFITLDNIPRAQDPGAYVFHFSPGLLETRGLHRLFVFDGGGEIVSYGDLMVE